ncbi:hypothetical protein HE1_01148 [Holospora elegans E1]|uniref:Uncharacterized protein n=1 Tax=Holospora elegans E1 TaxID=1427503 RepID=A0A023DZ42_9PROT|nr:hypothetical protein [Holospora elegans]GAJ46806.1 hypothetical protein HE1_01148 [Holospora elegans E1]
MLIKHFTLIFIFIASNCFAGEEGSSTVSVTGNASSQQKSNANMTVMSTPTPQRTTTVKKNSDEENLLEGLEEYVPLNTNTSKKILTEQECNEKSIALNNKILDFKKKEQLLREKTSSAKLEQMNLLQEINADKANIKSFKKLEKEYGEYKKMLEGKGIFLEENNLTKK